MKKITPLQKFDYICSKINNVHNSKYDCINELIKNNPELTQTKLVNLFKKGWPPCGIGTKKYWISRGWPLHFAKLKAKENTPKRNNPSPFSVSFWLEKNNPKTNKKYTLEEATYQRNSRRPINFEYWVKKGYKEEDAKLKAKTVKEENNIKGSNKKKSLKNDIYLKLINKKSIDYWKYRGFSEENAISIISEKQKTFSLIKCIEKYGIYEGYKKWETRQLKWQKTLKLKSKKEILEINRKKRSDKNCYFDNKSGVLYLVKIYVKSMNMWFLKIGITTRGIDTRFREWKMNKNKVVVIKTWEFDDISNGLKIENNILKKFYEYKYSGESFSGYTECFENLNIDKKMIRYIDERINS